MGDLFPYSPSGGSKACRLGWEPDNKVSFPLFDAKRLGRHWAKGMSRRQWGAGITQLSLFMKKAFQKVRDGFIYLPRKKIKAPKLQILRCTNQFSRGYRTDASLESDSKLTYLEILTAGPGKKIQQQMMWKSFTWDPAESGSVNHYHTRLDRPLLWLCIRQLQVCLAGWRVTIALPEE